MSDEYSRIAQEMVRLIEQVPTKRYGEINLVLAKELGLMLVDSKIVQTAPEGRMEFMEEQIFKELQKFQAILAREFERRRI